MADENDEKPPEFEAFRDLTRKLLDVSKDDLDKARRDESDDSPDRGYASGAS